MFKTIDINDFSDHGRGFVCGGFNARIGNKCDYVQNDKLILIKMTTKLMLY